MTVSMFKWSTQGALYNSSIFSAYVIVYHLTSSALKWTSVLCWQLLLCGTCGNGAIYISRVDFAMQQHCDSSPSYNLFQSTRSPFVLIKWFHLSIPFPLLHSYSLVQFLSCSTEELLIICKHMLHLHIRRTLKTQIMTYQDLQTDILIHSVSLWFLFTGTTTANIREVRALWAETLVMGKCHI